MAQSTRALPDLALLDGDCVLCSGSARFIARRDHAQALKLVAIQSEAGRAVASILGINPDAPETFALVIDGRAYFKSDAVIALSRALRMPVIASLISLLPMRIRDWIYEAVAHNRYRWFGRRDACLVSDVNVRARMVAYARDVGL